MLLGKISECSIILPYSIAIGLHIAELQGVAGFTSRTDKIMKSSGLLGLKESGSDIVSQRIKLFAWSLGFSLSSPVSKVSDDSAEQLLSFSQVCYFTHLNVHMMTSQISN